MFHWKTDELVADLEKLPGVARVEKGFQGGDYDTREILVFVDDADPDEERLHISGFPSTTVPCKDIDDAQCEWVELSDGQTSDGGLSSDHPVLGQVYLAIRRYLRSRGASVINTYEEIF